MGHVLEPLKGTRQVSELVEVAEVSVEVIAVISQELKYKYVVAIVLEKPLEIKKESNQTEECWSGLLIPRKIALSKEMEKLSKNKKYWPFFFLGFLH